MDSLRDKTSSKLIKKSLEMLPKGSNDLDLAYHGAMQRVEDQMEGFRLLAKQLLGWLTYSQRPMTVKELQHALAIEPGTSDFDRDNLGDVHEIVGICAGLVIVDQETKIVRLVHYTTQDYFRRNSGRTMPSAQEDIAISCLTYLLYDNFEDGWVHDINEATPGGESGGEESDSESEDGVKVEDEVEVEDEDSWIFEESTDWSWLLPKPLKARLQKYPFLRYAARYWATHARVCEQQAVKELLMSFAKSDRRVSSASQLMFHSDHDYDTYQDLHKIRSRSPLTAMHVLAYLGYEDLISELLNYGFVADSEDSTGRTPLWWAARQGHEAVVDLLLSQNHVNVNNRGRSCCSSMWDYTPLGIAVATGRDKTSELLIKHEDVNIDLACGDFQSPLHDAANKGHSTIRELLLTRREIDVNSRNYRNRTPLIVAAGLGREVIVEQLLKHKNIQINLDDDEGWTPLTLAARMNEERIVEILLGRSDIEVNKSTLGKTPLSTAVERGNEAVVKLLLSHADVNLNSKNIKGLTALHIAIRRARWGFTEETMNLLISHTDLDVNSKDQSGRSALHFAAAEGSEVAMKLLMSRKDLDVSLKDKVGRSALQIAAADCNAPTIKVSLGCVSIDVNAKDEDGRTPLHAVAERTHFLFLDTNYEESVEESVAMLLGHVGAEANPKDLTGTTPLALAIMFRHPAVVRSLCAHPDVDLDPKDNEGRDVYALIEEEEEGSSIVDEEMHSEETLELGKCLEILRTAIEARSRDRVRV